MQKSQGSLPLRSLSSKPAATLRIEDKPIKVLLIDGNPGGNHLLDQMLARAGSGAFILEHADRLSLGLERLAGGSVDVLLLDQGTPDSRGLESMARIRAQAMGVPIVILSSRDDPQNRGEALKRGAQEYLVKGKFNGEVLVRAIRRAMGRQRPLPMIEEKAPKPEPVKPAPAPEPEDSYLDNIVTHNPDGIIILDRKGIVRFVNPAVEILFGCKAGQLLGETLDSLPAVAGGKTELGIVRGDGEKRVAEIRVAEMKYDGETAYLASLRDITDRKHAEDETRFARMEAEAIKVNSLKAVGMVNEQARLAKEEAEAVKTSSSLSIAKANEVARLAAEEAGAANAAAARAVAKADHEVERAKEEMKAARAAATRANKEARLAKEEAEEAKSISAAAVAKAEAAAREAREEARTARSAATKAGKEARLAREEAEEVKTASARAIADANAAARLAKEEAKAAEAAAAKTVARANEEMEQAREEAKYMNAAAAKADKEAKLAREETEETKSNSARAIAKANEDARRAREEAEAARAASVKALARADEAIRLARDDAEEVKAAAAKAVAKAGEEVERAKEAARAAREAEATANQAAALTREEAEEVKVNSARAVEIASREARQAKEEAEEIKIASTRAVGKTGEEARLAKEEAEAAKAAMEAAVVRADDKIRGLDPMQSEFMSNIVHELRAPLHSILAFTKLILEGEVSDTETQQEFLTIIRDQSEHLRKLVEELVDISPAESERFNAGRERVAMGDLLRSSVQEFSGMAMLKHIVIHEDLPLTLPDIEADSQRLKQVMVNPSQASADFL